MSAAQDALRHFVDNSRQRLQQVLQRLQWNEQGVLKVHRVTASATTTAEQLPPSCCTDTEKSVQLDGAQLQQLLPGTLGQSTNTFNELQTQYTAAQRLILYEYIIKCTPRPHISRDDNASFAELVAVTKREHQKQRRHRKSKPTLHEEMHQLVQLQMQALQQQLHRQRRFSPVTEHKRREEERHHHKQSSSSTQYNRSRSSRHRSRSRERYTKRYRSRTRSRSRSRHQSSRHRSMHGKR